MTTDTYTSFQDASAENRRLLLQEELILEVTEALARSLKKAGIQRQELAERMGKSKGYVSQILSGGKNLTLRTLADVADALDSRVEFVIRKRAGKAERKTRSLGVKKFDSVPRVSAG